MSSCNVCSRNVQIVNSVSCHTKPFSVAKHDFIVIVMCAIKMFIS